MTSWDFITWSLSIGSCLAELGVTVDREAADTVETQNLNIFSAILAGVAEKEEC